MLIELAGAFLLMVSFPDLPLNPHFNPFGPVEFSTYQDCLSAAEITCASKATGQVHATWSRGPLR